MSIISRLVIGLLIYIIGAMLYAFVLPTHGYAVGIIAASIASPIVGDIIGDICGKRHN